MSKWDRYLIRSGSQRICSLCNHTLVNQKRSSTCGFNYHFKMKHPVEYEEIMGKSKPTKLADQPTENLKGTSPKPRLTQQSIRESFSLWTEEGQKTKDIERAIMQMICVDTLPLQTVEKAGFKNLLKVVIPQWKHLKSRTPYTKVEIPRLFNEYENRLKEELSEADSLAISFDLFADEGNIHQG